MSTPTAPNLGTIITSAVARKVIYGTYAIGVVLIGAAQVAFASAPELGGQPVWLTVSLAVAAYLGVPVSALALANTSTAEPKQVNSFYVTNAIANDEAVSRAARAAVDKSTRADHV